MVAVPWYQSKVQISQVAALVSAGVALSPKLGKLIGVNTPAEAMIWVETVFGFIALVAPILGTIWRAKSKLQPLTFTQAAADVHPATIAAKVNAQNARTAAADVAAQQKKAPVGATPNPTVPLPAAPTASPPVTPGKPWGT
jgi:predicted lipid-binding transport protein (Tim44 family)